jgi:nucleotide-binding universal stress UspA family protein
MEPRGFERILVATDGSEESQSAARAATSLAIASSAEVRIVHVWSLELNHRNGVWDVETRREADGLIAGAVRQMRSFGVDASGEIVRANHHDVAAAIVHAAEDFEADLVVVGSRGLSDWQSLLHHSVSHEVVKSLDVPVLVVRNAGPHDERKPRTVLVAVAGGDDVEPAVRAAIATARADGSRVVVLHVELAIAGAQGFAYVETDEEVQATIDRATALLTAAGIANKSLVVEPAGVATTIVETAAREGAEMIVIGSSRMGDVASLLFGSVTHRLLTMAPVPVLVAERARG